MSQPACPEEYRLSFKRNAQEAKLAEEQFVRLCQMQEYVDSGARLGWSINPSENRGYVYQPGRPVEVVEDPSTMGGDPMLPECVLPVHELW
jgi:hypothetical protein